MSASLINRALTNIRTELDFLRESGVISDQTFKSISTQLPEKYDPYAKDQLSVNSTGNSRREYMVAIYPFKPQQDGDLELRAGDKIEVLEKPSPEWFKGQCNGRVGMFPSNYVKPAYDDEKQQYRPTSPAPPQYNNNNNQLQQQQHHQSPPPQQQYQPPPQQQYQQQPTYYQQPPQQVVVQQPPQQVVVQQQPQQQQPQKQSAFSNFGSQLASAAVFGAGATIGSDIVNSIF